MPRVVVGGGGSSYSRPRRGLRPRSAAYPRSSPSPSPTPSRYYTPSSETVSTRRSASERAEARRERREERRTRVENIRGRNAELRLRRLRSRLLSIDNSLLGQPIGEAVFHDAVVGERWNRGGNQSIPNSTHTTIQYGTTDFTTEAAGYPPVYNPATNVWTIPAGLSGVWQFVGTTQFAANTTGVRGVRVRLNGTTTIYESRLTGSSSVTSLPIAFAYNLAEGDAFEVQVFQNSGASLTLNGGIEVNNLTVHFLGPAG